MANITIEDRIELKKKGYSDTEINDIAAMLDDCFVDSTRQDEIEKIYENEWHKGEYCKRIEGICQEGVCNRCEPYLMRNFERKI